MKSSQQKDRTPEVDQGWSWVVMCSAFIGFGLIIGQLCSISVYFLEFLEVFGETRSFTACIGSLGLGIFQIFGFTHGYFINHIGARGSTILGGFLAAFGFVVSSFADSVLQIIIYYGILTSFGFSLCFCGLVAAISQRFERFLFPVMGFCLAGCGVGITVFPYMLTSFIDTYGWRGSLLLQSAFSMQLVVVGSLLFPVLSGDLISAPNDETKVTEKLVVMTWRQRLFEPTVVLYSAAVFLQGLGLFTLYVVYKDFAVENGFESSYDIMMVVLGVGNILGRLVIGVASDHVSPVLCHVVTCVVCTAVMFGIYYNASQQMFVVLGGLFGFGQGSANVLIVIVVAHLFGRHEVATTFGYILVYSGVGTVMGAPLAGHLFDRFGSYFGCFLLSGVSAAASSGLLIVLYYINKGMSLRKLKADVAYCEN